MDIVQVVIGTYNGEKFLREQLDSILEGNYADIQIEISDDGSTDSTLDIAREYVSRYEGKVSLYQNEKNLGFRLNFLNALKRSSANYVMCCDQDDVWLPGKIGVTLEKMKSLEQGDGKPILVFTDAMMYDSESGKDLGSFFKNGKLNTENVDIAHILMENKCIGCTTMVNKEAVSYLHTLPDSIRVHDWWLAMICATFGKIGFVDEMTIRYRQHGNNIIGGTSFSSYFVNRIASLKKQRQAVYDSFSQGQAFYELFQEQMESDKKKTCQAFAQMPENGYFKRRIYCLKYGFLKTGLLRNVGLLLII